MGEPENKPETGPLRRVGGRFVPGVSGNPGGRPKVSDEARQALTDMVPAALLELKGLLKSDDERVRLAAVQVVLNRVLGKEAGALDEGEATTTPLANLTHEQLLKLVEKRDGH